MAPPKNRTILLRGQTNVAYAVVVLLLLASHLFDNWIYRDLDEALWPLRFALLGAARGSTPRADLLVIDGEDDPTPARLAAAVTRLSAMEAHTLGLDVPLVEGAPGLEALEAAVAASGRVVVSGQAPEGQAFARVREPPAGLRKGAADWGYVVFARDGRGRVNRLVLDGLRGDAVHVGWPLAAAQHLLEVPGYARVVKDRQVTLKLRGRAQPLSFRLDPQDAIRLDLGHCGRLETVDLATLEAGQLAPERVRHRLVVLPARGPDGVRSMPTPLGRDLPRSLLLACALATVLDGEVLAPPPAWLEGGLILALALPLAILGWRRGPSWVLGGVSVAVGAWWMLAAGALLGAGWVLPLVRPPALLLGLLAAAALRHRFRPLVGVVAAGGQVQGDAQAALGLGIKMMQAGRVEDAIRYFQKVADHQGGVGMRGRYHLALVLLAQGDARAVPGLVRDIDVTALGEGEAYALAEELERSGQLDTAHTLFSRLVQTDISDRDVRERLQRIQDRLAGVSEEDVARMIVDKVLDPRFQGVELLGRGGMGFVFQARDAGAAGRRVALKVLSPFYANQQEVYQRFLNEARGVREIDHPRVIRIFDVFQENLPYFSMEFLASRSLRELMAVGPIPLRSVLRLGVQVCEGLGAAHARGITHRDVKPENLMLDDALDAKVIDFGIAHFADRTRMTQTGDAIGTPLYMSPEQVRGLPIDARSDVYSFGVVLFQMLAGRPPYGAMGEHLTAPVPALPPGPEIPEALRQVVRRALAKDPAERFQSMAAMAEALGAVAAAGAP